MVNAVYDIVRICLVILGFKFLLTFAGSMMAAAPMGPLFVLVFLGFCFVYFLPDLIG